MPALVQEPICAISVKVGDTVQRVGDGITAGLRGVIIDTRPANAPYATSIKIKSERSDFFRNDWIPVKLWRKVD